MRECSFCGKTHGHIVQGPWVAICEDCVYDALRALAKMKEDE